MRGLARALVAGAVVILWAAPAPAQEARVRRGETIALTTCARCHAVGRVGVSPLAEAPTFRTLHRRYPVEDLGEALAEGIASGHPAMPEFRFDADEADALIAYLKSLER
ncbi:c-type cytochrome [Methylobacterium durans]|uniref:Cystathionine beta-lyase n=1 Tax=Methylobacterium durans TaxID=2202825 RepID=A0A2U8W0X7_9HYPH|nr:cytochrome c [Methylobacterium durans]AWN39754.1 cystathionine beta-lyase [Methylobacterium durans]